MTTSSVWHHSLQWKMSVLCCPDKLSIHNGSYAAKYTELVPRIRTNMGLPPRMYVRLLEEFDDVSRWRVFHICDIKARENEPAFKDAYIVALAECYLALARAHKQMASGATLKSILPS